MIASRAGLVVLAALAVALALVVALGGQHEVVDRRLVPDLDVADVTEIRFAGAWQGELVRTHDGWRRDGADVDRDAIDTLLAAVRGGHWHRRAEPSGAGTTRATVTFVAKGRTATLRVGSALPGSGETWIARDGDAVLVDDWIANALAPGPLDLVDRHPLAGVAAAREIVLGDRNIALRGHPRQMIRPVSLWVDPALVRALETAAARVEIVEPSPHLVVRARSIDNANTPPALAFDREWGGDAGECGARTDLVIVFTSRGQGCADAASWRDVTAAIHALEQPPDHVVDRRPLPIDAKQLVLADGATLDRKGRPRLADHDADPERVAELIAALAAPADVVALPAAKPTTTIRTEEVTLDLYDHVLARRGEPVALRPTPQAWATITRPSSALRDPTRWLEDAATIASISIDGTTYRRGGALGEWIGARDPALVEVVATALATVRAPSGPPPARVVHRIELQIAPPAGAPATHRLEVGDGCAARADGEPIVLPLAACTAVAAAAAR